MPIKKISFNGMQPLNFMFLALNRSLCSRSGDFLYVVSRMFEFFSCMNRLLMLYLQSRFFFHTQALCLRPSPLTALLYCLIVAAASQSKISCHVHCFPIFKSDQCFRDIPGSGMDSLALMDSIVDVIFFADILLNFHTTFVGPGGEV